MIGTALSPLVHRPGRRLLLTQAFAPSLYARLGFTHEATLRDATYRDGAYVDVLVYGLLRGDVRR